MRQRRLRVLTGERKTSGGVMMAALGRDVGHRGSQRRAGEARRGMILLTALAAVAAAALMVEAGPLTVDPGTNAAKTN